MLWPNNPKFIYNSILTIHLWTGCLLILSQTLSFSHLYNSVLFRVCNSLLHPAYHNHTFFFFPKFSSLKLSTKLSLSFKTKMPECVCAQLLSHVQLFAAPWMIAHQAPLSMELFKQEYWNRLPFPPPGHLPHSGIELLLLHLLYWQENSL